MSHIQAFNNKKKKKMDYLPILLLSVILFFSITLIIITKAKPPKPNFPPSRRISLLVIGYLHLIKRVPLPQTLISISQSLGNAPIFRLRLGNRSLYVISSRSIAEECFTRNDVVLANRPELIMSKHVGYNSTNMAAAPYGDHWRNLRRIAAVEILSTHRISIFMSIRKDEIRRLITLLSRDSLHRLKLDPSEKLYFPYEPGKQVRSAIKIKNTSKSHVAFKKFRVLLGKDRA